jgi:hypothetical protein
VGQISARRAAGIIFQMIKRGENCRTWGAFSFSALCAKSVESFCFMVDM